MLTRASHTPRKSLSRITKRHSNSHIYPCRHYQRLISSSSSNIHDGSNRSLRVPSRSIATAVETHNFTPNYMNFYPSSSPPIPSTSFSPHFQFLGDVDLLSQDSALSKVLLGFQQQMQACLLVGQFDRAEAFMRKAAMNPSDSDSLNNMNDAFLRGLVNALQNGEPGVSLARVLRWYDEDMPSLGLNPTPTSIAVVCRSLFAQSNKSYRERMLRKYLSHAARLDILDETIASGDYEDEEWVAILRIRPEFVALETGAAEREPNPIATAVEIKETVQKGLGLETLKKGIKGFKSQVKFLANADDVTLRKAQEDLEGSVVEAETSRWKEEHAKMLKLGQNPLLKTKPMEALLWQWKLQLESKILEHVKELKNKPSKTAWAKGFGVYFELVPADKLAAITIMSLLSLFQRNGGQDLKLSNVVSTIGRSIRLETLASERLSEKRHAKYLSRRTQMNSQDHPSKQTISSYAKEALQDSQRTEWPERATTVVVGLLVSNLVELAQIDGSPALSHHLEWKDGKRVGMITFKDELKSKLLNRSVALENASCLPMIAKPEPWKGTKGAYFRCKADLMRHTDVTYLQDLYLEAALANGDLDRVFNALNALSQTAWKINKPLLDIMIKAWNTGEALTNFPPVNPCMNYPDPPAEDADAITRAKYRHKVRQLDNLASGYQSNRCFINLQLEIAANFSGISLYFPHNIDFRGRAYPVPGVLNHMGADHARSLFLFAEGRPLGKEGLYWLHVHLATTFGMTKASFEERERFAKENIDNIRESVSNPLEGSRWWMGAEDPWQCLATCLELVAALDSPNPELFISNLPVHQDGTCNGLQHYAALGGDSLGAAQVNLVPGQRPADIYAEVARIVRELVEEDIKTHKLLIAQEALPFVTRKVVKRPVMTNVYGVTFTGAVLQVHKTISDIVISPESSSREHSVHEISVYITKNIFKAFGNLFTGAAAIQHWLNDCASLISSSLSPAQIHTLQQLYQGKCSTKRTVELTSPVIFTSPMGLPIVQPYRDEIRSVVQTALQSLSVRAPIKSSPVIKRKQKAAFPPNFIHSLDATHMMLTANKAHEDGVAFASVHDSFWTHASDVPKLNKILRDTFVELHSEDVTARLLAEFKQRYKGYMYLKTVPSNSPLGLKIKAHRKHTKSTTTSDKSKDETYCNFPRTNELLEEYERLTLLNSDNLEDRNKAEDMVTPGSLFMSMAPGDDQVHSAISNMTSQIDDSSETIDASPASHINLDILDMNQSTQDAETMPTLKPPKSSSRTVKSHKGETKFWCLTTFPPMPERGNFDVSTVRESTYFFS